MAGNPDDDARAEDGGVVEPDELDIEDDEHVRPLGDNRYVVSPDEPIGRDHDADPTPPEQQRGAEAHDDPAGDSADPVERDTRDDRDADRGGTTAGRAADAGEINVHRARARLTERMSETRGAYGFDATAQFGDEVVQQHLQANDIVTVFDALLLWYAEHLDDETPAEEAIGILLAESDIPVEYPPDALYALVRAHGLDRSDTIGDLVDAACDGTVRFPPQ